MIHEETTYTLFCDTDDCDGLMEGMSGESERSVLHYANDEGWDTENGDYCPDCAKENPDE